jgi:hypothetical protein
MKFRSKGGTTMSKDKLRETAEKCGRHPNQNLAVKDEVWGEKITVAEMVARSEAVIRGVATINSPYGAHGPKVS